MCTLQIEEIMYNEDVPEYDIKENVFFIVFALKNLISLVALQMFFFVFSSNIHLKALENLS